MSSELKPCPFCGGVAWDGASSMRVYCQECYAQVKQEISEVHDVVVARWNRRTPSPAVKALVEAASAMLDGIELEPRMGQSPHAKFRRGPTRTAEIVQRLRAVLAAVEREIGGA